MKKLHLKAFTLIELLVVISVGSMLTMLSIPLFTSVLFNEDLDTSAKLVLSTLRAAQSRSINGLNGSSYGVYFDNTSVPNRYILFTGSVYTPSDPLNEENILSDRLLFSSINLIGSSNTLVFAKNTGQTANSGNIIITNNINKTATISINPLGVTDAYRN